MPGVEPDILTAQDLGQQGRLRRDGGAPGRHVRRQLHRSRAMSTPTCAPLGRPRRRSRPENETGRLAGPPVPPVFASAAKQPRAAGRRQAWRFWIASLRSQRRRRIRPSRPDRAPRTAASSPAVGAAPWSIRPCAPASSLGLAAGVVAGGDDRSSRISRSSATIRRRVDADALDLALGRHRDPHRAAARGAGTSRPSIRPEGSPSSLHGLSLLHDAHQVAHAALFPVRCLI